MKFLFLALVFECLIIIPRPTAAADVDPVWIGHAAALQVLYGRVPTHDEVAASVNWEACVNHAVDLFVTQSEPAATVASAAVSACDDELAIFSSFFPVPSMTGRRDAARQRALVRVMALRSIGMPPGQTP